jgi:hypothetical protein
MQNLLYSQLCQENSLLFPPSSCATMRATHMELIKHGPGRPRKFGRPSRAVTVTLPEDVLTRLGVLDADLARAIVALVERKGARVRSIERAEIASYGNHAVITVVPVNALKRIAGVQLVPIGNGRAMISLEHPHSISEFELGLGDALERGNITERERQTLQAIASILRRTRRSRRVMLEERTIIVLETKRQRRRA